MNILRTLQSYDFVDRVSIFQQPGFQRNLQDSFHEEQSLKQIVDRTRAYKPRPSKCKLTSSNTINIKELNSKATSITSLDFGERSLKYQQLVKTIKAPSPIIPPDEVSMTDDEREWMKRVGEDVRNALGSMKVKDVGQVVVGFDL